MVFKATGTLVLVLAFLNAAGQACQRTFSGKITDSNGLNIPGAAVQITNEQGTVTDENGAFRIVNLCDGRRYHVIVQFLGFKNQEFDILIDGDMFREISLVEEVTQLREVVVHHDALHTEHLNNYTALDEKKLEESAGRSLGDALRNVTGVNTLQSGPGIYKPVIHGLHSNRILILNYGIRQEGQQWGAEHAPEIDPFIASNIVIVKDASAIKYGTDALGGVIVVNPPELPLTANVSGTLQTVYQSNGRGGSASGMLEGGIKNVAGFGWRIQGTLKKLGDFQTPAYTLTNTGIREQNYSASLGYHRESKGIDIFYSHFQSQVGILKGTAISSLEDLANAMDRETPLGTNSFSYSIGQPHQEVSHDLIKVNSHLRTSFGEWHAQYGFQDNERREYDLRMGSLSEIPAMNLQLRTHTLDVDWETIHSEKRSFSFGINAMYQNNQNVPGTQRLPFIPNFANTSGGLFALLKMFFKKWDLNAGSRYDVRVYDVKGYDFKNTRYHADYTFGNVSASIGANIRLKRNQTLNFNLSTAWRPPHVAELYSVGTHQSAAAIEYGLMLNDSTNEVMGAHQKKIHTEQAFKLISTYHKSWKNFAIEFTPYLNYISNYIYLRPEGVTRTIRGVFPYFRYRQTDVVFTGVDVSANVKWSKFLSSGLNASLLRVADVRNHNLLTFIPSNRYDVSIRYERGFSQRFQHTYVEVRSKYVAKQFRAPHVVTVAEIIDGEKTDPNHLLKEESNFDFAPAPNGYFLSSVAAGSSLKYRSSQYDFRISIDNLFNQRYRDYTNRYRYYADELGRNITVSVKFIF